MTVSALHRIAYFGPKGTFSEQAARQLSADAELAPYETIHAAMTAVRKGEADAACVPVENSVEGPVSATLDGLAEDEALVATAEALLPIEFSLLAHPDADPRQLRSVASHPHALAQVQRWLEAHHPQAEHIAASSTAAAAVAAAAGQYDAAVTAPVAADHYPLRVIATGVADVADARTRFLLLRRPGSLPDPTGKDRTSVVAAAANRTGALSELLTELAIRGINLTRLDARPIKGSFGRYRFFIDFEGHVSEARIGDALMALRRRCDVRFLGSHPRADGVAASIAPSAANADFTHAAAWVESVRNGETA